MEREQPCIERAFETRPRGRRPLRAGALCLALLMTAFGAGAAGANDKLAIAVNTTDLAPMIPLFIGLEKGYFAEQSIDITIVPTNSGQIQNAAMLRGDTQVAFVGLNAGFLNVGQESGYILLAGVGVEKPGFATIGLLVSAAAYDKGFKSPAQLAGKRISIQGPGGLSQYALSALARKYKVPFDQITVVTGGSQAIALASVQGGNVDGAIVGKLLAAQGVQSGIVKYIGLLGDEVPTATTSIMVTRPFLTANRPLAVRFLRAYLKGAALYGDLLTKMDASGQFVRTPQSRELVDVIVRQAQSAAGVATTAASVLETIPYVDPAGALDLVSVAAQLSIFQELKQANEGVDLSKIVDLSVLKEATSP